MIWSRLGKSAPPSIVSGTASAAASETAPRIPVQATISVLRHGGGPAPRPKTSDER